MSSVARWVGRLERHVRGSRRRLLAAGLIKTLWAADSAMDRLRRSVGFHATHPHRGTPCSPVAINLDTRQQSHARGASAQPCSQRAGAVDGARRLMDQAACVRRATRGHAPLDVTVQRGNRERSPESGSRPCSGFPTRKHYRCGMESPLDRATTQAHVGPMWAAGHPGGEAGISRSLAAATME